MNICGFTFYSWKRTGDARTCDEGDKLPALLRLNAHVPLRLKLWRFERPFDEVTRVVEAEHAIVILDVMSYVCVLRICVFACLPESNASLNLACT